MFSRRCASAFFPLQKSSPISSCIRLSSAAVHAEGGARDKSLSRKVISVVLISLTGGIALSALDDLAIYHGCSIKAMEKASENQAIVKALGEPIVRGPWYNASLGVSHRRHSVSCTFPVSGPQGTGIFQLKAVRGGDDSWFSFLRYRDWDILVMEALIHTPANEEQQQQTFRVSLTANPNPSISTDCSACSRQEASSSDKK